METHKDFRRALRRHHIARLKRTRAGYWGVARDIWNGSDRTLTPVQLGILVNTTTPCSCWMCGNPRRKDRRWQCENGLGLTFQEVKQQIYAESFNDE